MPDGASPRYLQAPPPGGGGGGHCPADRPGLSRAPDAIAAAGRPGSLHGSPRSDASPDAEERRVVLI